MIKRPQQPITPIVEWAPAGDEPASTVSSGGAQASMVYQTHPEGTPMAYIAMSAVFLAIAVVGFGLWLAFAVF